MRVPRRTVNHSECETAEHLPLIPTLADLLSQFPIHCRNFRFTTPLKPRFSRPFLIKHMVRAHSRRGTKKGSALVTRLGAAEQEEHSQFSLSLREQQTLNLTRSIAPSTRLSKSDQLFDTHDGLLAISATSANDISATNIITIDDELLSSTCTARSMDQHQSTTHFISASLGQPSGGMASSQLV